MSSQPSSQPSSDPSRGAILLAGGRATRMGGVAKPLLEVGGQSLLQRAIDACLAAGCSPITIVGARPDQDVDGDDRIPPSVQWTREDPPFTGPAAAAVVALGTWEHAPDWTFVLACDLPRIDAAVQQLRRDMLLLPSDTDGMCLGDAASKPQWLTGVYRTDALARAAATIADQGRNASMRAFLDGLAIAVVAASDDITADVDTWEDLNRARGGERGTA